jgi:hypothetical protein
MAATTGLAEAGTNPTPNTLGVFFAAISRL